MSVLKEPCLVLNKSWEPITTCTVQTAFGYLCNESGLFMSTEKISFVKDGREIFYDPYTLHTFEAWKDLPIEPIQIIDLTPSKTIISTGRFYMRVPEIVVLQTRVERVHRKLACTKRNIA